MKRDQRDVRQPAAVVGDRLPARPASRRALVREYEDAPGFSTTVELTIEAVPAGQRLRLVQQGFPAVGTRDDFAGAWPDVLGELAGRLSS